MTVNADRLYHLLPQIIQMRDVEQGEPLRALLRVIARQVQVVDDDIQQLYENWFIETCQDWVVPYLGTLVGYEPVEDAIATHSAGRDKILIPRREVANTIRYRRRKGTLALLESLGMDVTGWPAVVAVEFFNRLAAYEHLGYIDRLVDTLDLHDTSALGYLDTAFETTSRILQIGHDETSMGESPASLGIGLFVWRMRAYSVTCCDAPRLDENQPEYYTFSVLGNDAPLYTQLGERTFNGEPDPRRLPIPISRQALEDDLREAVENGHVTSHYYGEGRSFCIEIDGWPNKNDRGFVSVDKLIAADLSGLEINGAAHYTVPSDKIAVDPELGRILFPPGQSRKPRGAVRVSYHYGFSTDLGGGEYDRTLSPRPINVKPDETSVETAEKTLPERELIETTSADLGKTLTAWQEREIDARSRYTLVEIQDRKTAYAPDQTKDSSLYEGDLPTLELHAGKSLEIRAANRCRPVLMLGDQRIGAPDGLTVIAHPGSCLILDGLLIAGRGLRVIAPEAPSDVVQSVAAPSDAVKSDAAQFAAPSDEAPSDSASPDDTHKPVNIIIRHCTLVPGWMLRYDCDPRYGQGASIELVNVYARMRIDRSIVGSISVAQEHCDLEPCEITLNDSILDSTHADQLALYGEDGGTAYANLTIRRCTVFGSVLAREMPLAENTIFRDPVMIERRQKGCVRYSYVRPGSRTPRRFRCQPDLAMRAAEEKLHQEYEVEVNALYAQYEAAYQEAIENGNDDASRYPLQAELDALRQALEDAIPVVRQAVGNAIYPNFSSVRYGKPTYAQLAATCPVEIGRGAEAESEMGVYYHLFNPQRAANLHTRLEEFTPAGAQITIIYAS